MEYFKKRQLDKNTTVIEDPVGVKMYLITGEERAALLDTGTGLGDTAAYVHSLTALPLTVLCTHGHIDHAGGASRFAQVYLPAADTALEQRHCTQAMKQKQNELRRMMNLPPVPAADISPARKLPFLPLKDGQEFWLGGLTLRACAFPGHTQGMTCILLVEKRALLLGDACNPRVFLFGAESSTVEEYRNSVLAFKNAHKGAFDTAYLSHGPSDTISPAILDDCAALCGEIMARKDDALPFAFMDEHGTIAGRIGEDGNSADGRLANIVYDRRRIFKV